MCYRCQSFTAYDTEYSNALEFESECQRAEPQGGHLPRGDELKLDNEFERQTVIKKFLPTQDCDPR